MNVHRFLEEVFRPFVGFSAGQTQVEQAFLRACFPTDRKKFQPIAN